MSQCAQQLRDGATNADAKRQTTEQEEWHVLPLFEEGDDAATPATAHVDRPTACHVLLRSAAPDSSPPVGALTGRAHQRYEDERRLLCGCVPFRVDVYAQPSAEEGDAAAADARPSSVAVLRVLLVASKKKDDWIFAKGGWEQFESMPCCAQRELLEEGGVEGALIAALPAVEFSSKKKRTKSRLYPFLLQVSASHARWAEQSSRSRRWVRMEEVSSLLRRDETRAIWSAAMAELRARGFVDERGQAVFKQPPSGVEQMRLRKEIELQAAIAAAPAAPAPAP